MKQKQKVIYYNERGKIDKFATYINNNWLTPVVFFGALLISGLIETI